MPLAEHPLSLTPRATYACSRITRSLPQKQRAERGQRNQDRLHRMEHFHPYQVEMGTTEHLALQKFEPVHLALCGPIAPGQRAGSTNSGIVSTDPVDKAGQFRHMARFCSREPGVQYLHLAFFEQGDKFLAQEVDSAQVLIKGHLLNLSLLHFGEF